jgi:STE24 endopeptidase
MEQVVVAPNGSKNQAQFSVQLPPNANHSNQTSDESDRPTVAKEYSRRKIVIGIAGTVLFYLLTIAVVAFGISRQVEDIVGQLTSNAYVRFLLFALILGLAELIVTFPLSFYSGYYLEHKYQLSNQSFRRWMWEGLKGMIVSIPIGVTILLAFYFCLKTFGSMWWLPVGIIMFVLSVVLARLAPVLIFPLFYKFMPLEDGPMKTRILSICDKVGVAVEGIYTFDLSKNTKKANAAFTGIGKSKRIILGDTLVQSFTDDEVETVFAHELGHYKKKHIWLMMGFGTLSSFLGLFLTAWLYELSLPWFGFVRLDQIAALPLLTLWLGIYSLIATPLGNHFSRRQEYAADRYAVEITRKGKAFTDALTKLALINLADTAPHTLIEFLFHSHPSIEKRIQAVREMRT